MKRKFFRIIAAILLMSLMIGTCASCDLIDKILGKDKNQEAPKGEPIADLVIFENGKYNCEFIYPEFSDAAMSELRNELRAAFKAKTGITPSFKGDDKVDASAETFEVLLGSTNRPESATPDGVGENTDAYYGVSVVGNKIVINGSDTYQLGVALKYFIENYLSGAVAETVVVPGDLSEVTILKDFTRELWKLDGIPAYPVGANKLGNAIYKSGTTITDLSSANRNKSDVNLQQISFSTEAEFTAYLGKLESYGYEKEYENITEEIYFFTYKSADQRVHVSFKVRTGEVHVISDPKGISVDEFGYSYTPKAGERSEYYLYGLPMADGKNNGHPNAGTLSIIKCADNSVIIIDGGAYEGDGGTQMYGDDVMNAFDEFLHNITGTAKGDKVRVSAWYLSHYHADHVMGFLEFLKIYYANYDLERVIANIPIQDCGGSSNPFPVTVTNYAYGLLDGWRELIETKYPNCKEIKVHTGQKIQIADVTLDVLYTHEDLLNANNRFASADSNDTSTCIRVDNGQMSMISLGDASQPTEAKIRRNFTEVTLKSDIIQPAHHLIYAIFDIFKEIQPTYAMVTQSIEMTQSSSTLPGQGSYKDRYDTLVSLVARENCYFAGNESVGFAVVDEKIERIYYREGVVGRQEGQG